MYVKYHVTALAYKIRIKKYVTRLNLFFFLNPGFLCPHLNTGYFPPARIRSQAIRFECDDISYDK